MRIIILLILVFGWGAALASSPLMPVKLDTPRDTMMSYFEAMKDYNKGLKTKDSKLIQRIDDAARCFNLEDVPFLVRKEKSRQAAIYLKEVIDRVIVIDYSKVPDQKEEERWRLKGTEIVISKVDSGDNKGEFLFSPTTTFRAEEFFHKVKHLPYLEGTSNGAGYEEPWLQKIIPNWAQGNVLGLQKWQWLGIFISIFIGLIIKVFVEFIIIFIKGFTPKNEQSLRQRLLWAIDKPLGLISAAVFWYLSVHFLKIEGMAAAVIFSLIQIFGSIGVIWAAYRLTDVLSELLSRIADKTESDLDDQLVPLVSRSLRVFVIVIGVLATIQNLGFNVMSLVAGLGLGGLAFALAAKDTAANLFGSIMIILDRPFKIGDWIVAGKVEGTVEDIGFRSTRIRTFYNSQISIPNSELATVAIDNMGRREYRRYRANIGITYGTAPEKINKFIEGIKQIILDHPHTRKDYFHVVFDQYQSSSLNILVYLFLSVPDWSDELKAKQEINLKIFELASSLGVNFAFPSQSIYVESFPSSKSLVPNPTI